MAATSGQVVFGVKTITNQAFVAPKFTFSNQIMISNATVLPTLAVGECVLVYGQGVGATTNKPTTNGTQKVGYRTSAGALASVGVNTTVGLDLYGKCGLLVCLTTTYCQLII